MIKKICIALVIVAILVLISIAFIPSDVLERLSGGGVFAGIIAFILYLAKGKKEQDAPKDNPSISYRANSDIGAVEDTAIEHGTSAGVQAGLDALHRGRSKSGDGNSLQGGSESRGGRSGP